MFFSLADKQAPGRPKENTYGATGKSGFLFRIGSDMVTEGGVIEKRGRGEVEGRKVGEGREGKNLIRRF